MCSVGQCEAEQVPVAVVGRDDAARVRGGGGAGGGGGGRGGGARAGAAAGRAGRRAPLPHRQRARALQPAREAPAATQPSQLSRYTPIQLYLIPLTCFSI